MENSLKSKLERLKTATRDDVDTQSSAGFSMPMLQWFNKADLHIETEIEGGGWGIRKTDTFTPPPIGPVQGIKHLSGNTSMMAVTNKPLKMAILSTTLQYTRWFVNGAGKPAKYIAPDFWYKRMDKDLARSLGVSDVGAAESGKSIFVVLFDDPKREVYEIPVKTFIVDDLDRIVKLTALRLKALQEHLVKEGSIDADYTFPLYSQWIEVGVGANSLEGSTKQSAVTHPEIKWPGIDLPLKDLWLKFATRKADKKPMVCDADAQWSFLRDKLSVDDLMAAIPDDDDLDMLDKQRVMLNEIRAKGFRQILPATPAGIQAALEGSSYAQLPPPSGGNYDGDGVSLDNPNVDPVGVGETSTMSIGDLCKQTPDYANKLFTKLKTEYGIAPNNVLKLLGAKSLFDVILDEQAVVDHVRASLAQPAN